MIDPKIQLNIEDNETNSYLEYTFMKYQLMLHYVLLTGGFPTQVLLFNQLIFFYLFYISSSFKNLIDRLFDHLKTPKIKLVCI
jgi:hypothetical protein